jgi:outer membrane protein OmpA-like peptidoglycan-associated protein
MRILFVGILVFITWSALSTHFYLCKIKGLCEETITIVPNAVGENEEIVSDTSMNSSMRKEDEIPGTMKVNFEFDKSDFRADASTDSYFDKSKAYIDNNQQAKLIFTGHTDAVGTDEYNQSLGFRRAQSMMNYFEGKGIIPNKMIVESKGEKDPVDDNNSISGRANNRRTVVTIKK